MFKLQNVFNFNPCFWFITFYDLTYFIINSGQIFMELLKTKCFSSMFFSFRNILTLFFKPIRLSKVVRYKSAAGTRRAKTSLVGPLKVLTSGTYRGHSGESQGTNTKMKKKKKRKNCFSEAIVLALRIYSSFLQEEQIFKCSQRGRPRDVYGNKLQDVMGTK